MRVSSFCAAVGSGILASLLLIGPASATAISGSDTIGAGVISTNETAGNLGSSTSALLSGASMTFSVFAVGAGDFSVVPVGTAVTLASATLDFTNPSSFGFNDAGVGIFAPTSILVYDQTPTTIDVFLTGTFTPGSLFPSGSTAPLGASETIGFTQTAGGEISLSGTFASPPASNPVPEPLTLSVVGAGLAGLVAIRRRKKSSH